MCHFTFKEMISAHFAKLNPQNLYVVVILVHLFTHLLHNVFLAGLAVLVAKFLDI